MITPLLKVLAFCATTAVVIPYTTALVCNTAYGWPRIKNKYRRAFSPRKVYALNLAVIQQMILIVRFLPLYLQWRKFYKHASAREIMKDRTYGRNNQKLDLHFPRQWVEGGDRTYPVVVFVYGGAWSGGSKKMYGLVCSSIANRLGAIVCCPDFSKYPKGHVDNMVDDVNDCLTWLCKNVEHYSGDKSNIMMVGHSSGAHLCFMSVYEMFVQNASTNSQTLEFQDTHFNGSSAGQDEKMAASSESFYVVDGLNNGDAKSSENLSTQISETQLSEGSMLESDLEELKTLSDTNLRYRGSHVTSEGGSGGFVRSERSGDGGFLDVGSVEDSGYNEAVISGGKHDDPLDEAQRLLEEENMSVIDVSKSVKAVVDVGSIEDSGYNEAVISGGKQDDPLDEAQRLLEEVNTSTIDVSKSVKAVVGLAGVYHIGDHFEHESKRGIEDLSSMSRAMYGPEDFDRFSPTTLFKNCSHTVRLPKFVLLHGTDDHVVPISSTIKFAEVLQTDVMVRIIPTCDHYEICLDLNKPSRKFFDTIMAILDDTAKSAFTS